jgi:hypothetical protein
MIDRRLNFALLISHQTGCAITVLSYTIMRHHILNDTVQKLIAFPCIFFVYITLFDCSLHAVRCASSAEYRTYVKSSIRLNLAPVT